MLNSKGSNIVEAAAKLKKYIEHENFKGYDPVDIFNSIFPLGWLPNIVKAAISQVHMRNPVNFRAIIGIKKEYNAMALGVLLKAYAMQYEHRQEPGDSQTMQYIFERLIEISCKGKSGYCWGNNFDWVGRDGKVAKNYPNLVTTCFVANGIYKYYQVTGEIRAKEVIAGIAAFIVKDIPRIETEHGICFSYTNLRMEACYNANMLAAETLAKNYSIFSNSEVLKLATRAVEFTIAHQQLDGHWNYSIDLENGIERQQIDFHQGYLLLSLSEFVKYSGIDTQRIQQSLQRGIEYYKNRQFFHNGRAKWRLPNTLPIETHYHAVGILCFCELSKIGESYLHFANKIAKYAVDNIFDEKGYFYFRKYNKYINKISYMRWTQSFMFLALISLDLKTERSI